MKIGINNQNISKTHNTMNTTQTPHPSIARHCFAQKRATKNRLYLPSFTAALLCVAMVVAPSVAQAKLYKVVGPDGKVTYTDKPPTKKAKGKVKNMDGQASTNIKKLPATLRKPASKYPVVLYTSTDSACQGCDAARNLLRKRGIPHTEKLVNTPQDWNAFRKKTNNDALPLIKIGSKQIVGFKASKWNEYLTVAEYPKTSVLKKNHKFAKAKPLTNPKPVKKANTEKAKKLTDAELHDLEIREREEEALRRNPNESAYR